MKKAITILLAVAAIAAAGYYYYHNHVEEVTEYYVVKAWKDKAEVARVRDYQNDSVAVETERRSYEKAMSRLLEKFGKDTEAMKEPKDEVEEMMNNARVEAYKDLLSETRTIVVLTHTRSTSPKEVLEIMKKDGLLSDKAREYAEEHKVKASVYPI